MAKGRRVPRCVDEMRPHFEEIQAHYDLSDDFFGHIPGPVADLQLRVLRA